MNSYSGREKRTYDRLMQGKNPNQEGIWEIRGEDSNPDLGGTHHEPLLGTFRGRYEEVVEHALSMPRFFEWGYGGSIREVVVESVTENKQKEINALKNKKIELEKEIEKIDKRITWLGVGGDV